MYRIFFINMGYYHGTEYANATDALAYARRNGFDAAITHGKGNAEGLVATYRTIGGVVWHCEVERAQHCARRDAVLNAPVR